MNKGRRQKYTVDFFTQSAQIYARIMTIRSIAGFARYCGVDKGTLYTYIHRYPQVKDAVHSLFPNGTRIIFK